VVLAVGLIVLASVLLIVARRRAGGVHMFRAILGPLGMLLALLSLAETLSRMPWVQVSDIAHRSGLWPAAEVILNSARVGYALFAAGLVLVSTMILAWPAREAPPPQSLPPQEGSAR